MSLNRVFIMGNLGADPELRYTPAKMAVCTLRVATGERRKNQEGEWVETTEWHSIVVWGKTAENCSQYLQKGRQVFIEGRLQTRKWQDQEGKDRYKTEIVASNVQFIGGRGGSTSDSAPSYDSESAGPSASMSGSMASPAAAASGSGSEHISFEDDDIPF